MQVSIIGFGRFGRLLAGLLQRYHGAEMRLLATSRSDYAGVARGLGLAWAPLDEAARADVVMLCVPMRELGGVIEQLRRLVRPGAVVMDTCSVKVYPAQLMAAKLPPAVEILATHPMFGPDGVRQFGIAGQRLVICPIRIGPARLAMVESWFQAMGVAILRMTPAEHDRQAAISQGLVHFIGRAIERAGLSEPAVTTNNAQRLFELARAVAGDSLELFDDLETLNPFAAEVRQAFLKAAQGLDEELARGTGSESKPQSTRRPRRSSR